MKLKTALPVAIFLLWCNAQVFAASPLAEELCTCLETADHNTMGRRDSGVGVSIVVPARSRKFEVEAGEGYAIAWTDGATRISYHGYPKRMAGRISFDQPASNQCVIHVRQDRVLIEPWSDSGRSGISAIFEGKPKDSDLFEIDISARSRKSMCTIAATTLWSAIFGVDVFERLKLLSIAHDKKSFSYQNETGSVMTARIGDLITRDWGRVTSIDDFHVTISELEPDGKNGWLERPRNLYLRNKQGPQ
jgi:hypothetical protein